MEDTGVEVVDDDAEEVQRPQIAGQKPRTVAPNVACAQPPREKATAQEDICGNPAAAATAARLASLSIHAMAIVVAAVVVV